MKGPISYSLVLGEVAVDSIRKENPWLDEGRMPSRDEMIRLTGSMMAAWQYLTQIENVRKEIEGGIQPYPAGPAQLHSETP